jgi:hypothetical protein
MSFDNPIRTPYGVIPEIPKWIDGERAIAIRDIQRCIRHRAPQCQCWKGTRDRLGLAVMVHGACSPESHLAGQLVLDLEYVERAPRNLRRIWNSAPISA